MTLKEYHFLVAVNQAQDTLVFNRGTSTTKVSVKSKSFLKNTLKKTVSRAKKLPH